MQSRTTCPAPPASDSTLLDEAAAGAALTPTVRVFDRLLDSGLDPATAFERLAEEMHHAGYPKDYPQLSQADASAIFTAIVGSDAP